MQDTIVALATPPGEGAIGVIRLSGKDAVAIADEIFVGKRLAAQPSHTIHFGKITDGEQVIDEAVASLYKSPRSYTGEDVVELSCHGSHYILQQVLSLCVRKGAVMAQAGEFTQRAFLNSKMDLAQAEAVADLIASQSAAQHRAAMHTMRGGFSADLKQMREQLITFSALIELELDFSQEDVEFADRRQLYNLITDMQQATAALVASFQLGNVIKEGVSVAIIGKPNAGKSTLLNALLNEERAIVSEIAGTTRDTIEEALYIHGIRFRLIDTAGIREHSTDVIENIGMQRSREMMEKADVIVYLFDIQEETPGSLQAQRDMLQLYGKKYLLVANKMDAATDAQRNLADAEDVIAIAAKNKDNIPILTERLYELAVSGALRTEGTIVTNARHHTALQQVQGALQDIRQGMDSNIPGDLLALDIRRCLHYLGEITGQVTTEDKLDYIFSKFCIGK